MPGKRHEQEVESYIARGYERNGFVAAMRKTLIEGFADDVTDIPRPDAWRVIKIEGFRVFD